MALAAIYALRVPAAKDATLALRATAPKLAEALAVMEAWQFEYRTCAVWDKVHIGMGYHFRGRHELLLIGVRGSPGTPAAADRPPSIFAYPRGAHSAKPPEVRGMLEVMYPARRRLELFARESAPGWTAWGDEA